MAFESKFVEMSADDILRIARDRKEQGWRFVQMMCTNTDDGIDVEYSYMKDGVLENYTVKGVQKGQQLPSITGEFLAAFVFENESHDLFGVDITDIAIDFKGRFYDLAMAEPMTVISPEQKAARDKAAKIAAAKAAKAAKEAADAPVAPAADAGFEAKLAAMDPEKAAKVRAAMEAKKAREAAKQANEGKGE